MNAKPEIRQNKSNAYPIITQYGIEINKAVNIDYGENTNNYYSLDGGNSWIKYTDEIKIQKECNLRAKTVIEGEITRESQENITMQLADNSLGLNSYDKDDTTYEIGTKKCIQISNEIYGETINIHLVCPAYNHVHIKFYEKDGKTEIGKIGYWHTNNGDGTLSLTIPENAFWLKIISIKEEPDLCYIYEINLDTKPIGDESSLYPYIDDEGIHNDNKYKIKYFYTATKKLYSKDKINWIEYPQEGITVEKGEKIYAKSIDDKGNDSEILTFTNNISNIIGSEAYDGDTSTAFECLHNNSPYYINIMESAQNKEIYLKFTANNYSAWYFRFYNDRGEKISTWTGVVNQECERKDLIIPVDAKKLEIVYTGGTGGKGSFYEMQIVKDK